MKTVCIHQPDFIPYMGFFHRLLETDIFIVLDDAQFIRDGWHHRDQIKNAAGKTWITLPVNRDDLFKSISEVRLVQPQDWKIKHLNLLKENYRKAPYYAMYYPQIEAIYAKSHARLMEINMDFLEFLFGCFGLEPRPLFSSELHIQGKSTARLVEMVQQVGGNRYLTGTGSRAYLEESQFTEKGIAVAWQTFQPPDYPQLHGTFIPHLSSIDVVFNLGPDAKEFLRKC